LFVFPALSRGSGDHGSLLPSRRPKSKVGALVVTRSLSRRGASPRGPTYRVDRLRLASSVCSPPACTALSLQPESSRRLCRGCSLLSLQKAAREPSSATQSIPSGTDAYQATFHLPAPATRFRIPGTGVDPGTPSSASSAVASNPLGQRLLRSRRCASATREFVIADPVSDSRPTISTVARNAPRQGY
jgi:hypothetical protein